MSAPASEALARRLAELADSKQADEIVVLDMRDLVSYTDFLAICTARNERQARAIIEEVRLGVKQRAGCPAGRHRGCRGRRLDRPRLPRLRAPRLHRRGAGALPARGPLARGAAPGAGLGRARGFVGDRRLKSLSEHQFDPVGELREMPSEGALTVPRMGSFKRVLLGYRRPDVDAAISARDERIRALEREAEDALARWRSAAEAAACSEQELAALSGMVIEREREIHSLGERLREANERHDRSIASLEAVSARLEEIQAQARGQATRIRMKALREAVEVGRRAQELSDAQQPLGGGGRRGAEPKWPPRSRAAGPLRGTGQGRDRPARRLLPVGRLRGRGGPDRRHLRDLGRALLRGPRDALDAPRGAGRAAPRAGGSLPTWLPRPPHRGRQPDPRYRRGPGSRAAGRLAPDG